MTEMCSMLCLRFPIGSHCIFILPRYWFPYQTFY
ncbi:hypothetical protein T08_14757 [Trichinella sp. T8]|nr:hypothetical protein T08_14757 [Trichinella sp. T8]